MILDLMLDSDDNSKITTEGRARQVAPASARPHMLVTWISI